MNGFSCVFAVIAATPARWASKLAALNTETAGQAGTDSFRLFFK